MTIDLVTVETPLTVVTQLGTVEIERGKVLMGEIIGSAFHYPLTIADTRVDCVEPFENKRILPILEGLKLT